MFSKETTSCSGNLKIRPNWFKHQIEPEPNRELVQTSSSGDLQSFFGIQKLHQELNWSTASLSMIMTYTANISLLIVWVAVWTHTFRKLKFHCYLHSFLSFTLLPTLEVSLRLSTSVNIIIISPLQSIRIRDGMIRFGSVRFGSVAQKQDSLLEARVCIRHNREEIILFYFQQMSEYMPSYSAPLLVHLFGY